MLPLLLLSLPLSLPAGAGAFRVAVGASGRSCSPRGAHGKCSSSTITLEEWTTELPTRTSYVPREWRERPRNLPSTPGVARIVFCCCVGGLSTTARHPKACRSIVLGGTSVSRW